MARRNDLRNVAIVAHVDHGKTTLVDAMLRQTGALRAHREMGERILDTGDLEREKGITILAKHTRVQYRGVGITIVDTPGHADFGGEVERGLAMVDGVLLLVDASEGPLPQTRFVLRKTLEARLAVVAVVNKVDRSDARVGEVVREIEDLFLDLGADEEQISYPVLYADARAGWATVETETVGRDLGPLFETIIERIPPPSFTERAPLQAMVTNLDASPYLGRLAICRIHNGTLRRGALVARCRPGGEVDRGRVAELFGSRGLEEVSLQDAGPGEIVTVAGFPEISIGDTLADPEDPRPLAALLVDEPTLAVTIGINTSPLAGHGGHPTSGR